MKNSFVPLVTAKVLAPTLPVPAPLALSIVTV